MATYSDFPIVSTYDKEEPQEFNPQRLLNMYPIYNKNAKKSAGMTTAPGLSKLLETSLGLTVRQVFAYGNVFYAVVSEYVYEINASYIATLKGTLNSTTGYVGMASNGSQVILVDGIDGFIIQSGVLTQITAAGFPAKPLDVTYQDGYFIVVAGETNRFYISALNDGFTWDALDYAETLSKPDTLIGVRELHRMLFLFGQLSVEVWTNAGLRDFPFQRQNNMLLEYGCAAPGSIAVGFDKLFWLAGDKNGVGSVMMTDGTRPAPISTRPIDIQIQGFSDISDARAYIYKEEGHFFYVLNFTIANKTFVYDVTTQEWSERDMLVGDRHVGECHTFFQNTHIIGAYNSNKIYEQSRSYYNNDGEAIHRLGIPKTFVDPSYKKVRVDRFQIDTKSGYADQNGIDFDPEIFLSISKDGGASYGNIRNESIGRIGERRFRTIWRRLGTAYNGFTIKWEFYGAVPFDILGAAITFEVTGR